MKMHGRSAGGFAVGDNFGILRRSSLFLDFAGLTLFLAMMLIVTTAAAHAQGTVNVLTAHNDIGRTGQNLNESALTPQSVNDSNFGKLFSQTVKGLVWAQPLYVSSVTIPGLGTHNVVYVATSSDIVYAFDADSNGGINATPLWQAQLLTNTSAPAGATNNFGIVGTPVIDPVAGLMYVVSSETVGSAQMFRLHALDITTGNEKLGGPVQIQASTPGTGNGSSGGVLTFNPGTHYQRSGLLLVNGIVYFAFGSVNDNGAWHGWIFSYNASNLHQVNFYCTSPNGAAAGIWMGGSGLAAEVVDPVNKPYGRMYLVTGNGTYNAKKPYSGTMGFAMSILNFDLTGGIMSVADEFTPHNQQTLDGQDGDLGSGGAILIPAQTPTATYSPLIQMGKAGMIYVLDRNNMGGYNTTSDQVVQEIQTQESGPNNWGVGVWGAPAYWDNNLYFGGAQYAQVGSRVGSPLTAYSFTNGQISSQPTSQTAVTFAYPGPTPSISANGTGGAILWALKADAYPSGGQNILLAYDATNLANQLYSSADNPSRDAPGVAVKFVPPTVANGKVYVGTNGTLSVFGLLNGTQVVQTPVITPGSGTFAGSQTVTITDSTSGSQIYYTTDGTPPTAASNLYGGPFAISSSMTITAIGTEAGYQQSAQASATFSSTTNAANPIFSLAAGTYTGSQTLTLTDATNGATIYYTVDGSTPTTSSAVYGKPVAIPVSETIQAFAIAPGLSASSLVSSAYVITPPYAINFTQGFSQAQGPIQFNGTTDLDDFRLQLTNGGTNQAGSAFFATPVSATAFTTDFTFQQSNPSGDGMTFTLQHNNAGALGSHGGGLGYQGIPNSVAIKFDLYSNAGEGPNSTGLYINGAAPTLPAIDMTSSGLNLHSGDYIDAHITYDGVHLNMTLTDEVTLATFSTSFTVNIPSVLGGPSAYVGFTGGTGGASSSQKVTYWTYLAGQPPVPDYPNGFDSVNLMENGSALSGSTLQMTNGGSNQTTSAYYGTQVSAQAFTSDFDFQTVQAVAHGFTFVLQNSSPTALGYGGSSLGYGTIGKSVAIKFDYYNNNGEGNDSTGFYTNGATPSVPAIDISSSGVILNSGDVIHAHIVYDGTTLTWTLTDKTLSNQPSVTNSVSVNIPHTIRSNVAYVGFTASSGGTKVATQNILNWTFTNP